MKVSERHGPVKRSFSSLITLSLSESCHSSFSLSAFPSHSWCVTSEMQIFALGQIFVLYVIF